MKRPTYHEDLIDRLKNPRYALGYLNACMNDEDEGVLLLAIRHVAEAHGGIRQLAKKAKLNREHLFRMLSKNGHPHFENVRQLLAVFGWRLALVADRGVLRRAA